MTPNELRSLADSWDADVSYHRPSFAPAIARLCAEQHEALRLIATGARPDDSPTWHSGKSWRIELARSVVAKLPELERP